MLVSGALRCTVVHSAAREIGKKKLMLTPTFWVRLVGIMLPLLVALRVSLSPSVYLRVGSGLGPGLGSLALKELHNIKKNMR